MVVVGATGRMRGGAGTPRLIERLHMLKYGFSRRRRRACGTPTSGHPALLGDGGVIWLVNLARGRGDGCSAKPYRFRRRMGAELRRLLRNLAGLTLDEMADLV